mgnify:CR=1 FL=1
MSQNIPLNEEIRKYKLLFICLGNICRSPAANAVMQKLVDERGLSARFTIDSAGIGMSANYPTNGCANTVSAEVTQ